MLDLLRDLFFDYTIRNVALGAAILGVVGGTLGSFAVLRRQGLFGDALAHATLPGVCVAYMVSEAKVPIVLLSGAALSAGLGALLIITIVNQTRIKQDAALGIVLSVFFGAGAVLITYIAGSGSGNQSGLDRFIFGQAATLVREWPGQSQHARAVHGLECLAAIGSDVALMQLNGIAQKLKFKGLQNQARELMNRMAGRVP